MRIPRRQFLARAARGLGLASLSGFAPAIVVAGRPIITHGVQSGDVTSSGAILWSRADRPSRMLVELAATEAFRDPRRVVGPAALEATDYTAKLDLSDLPTGEEIFYRVSFQSLDQDEAVSEPVIGRFRTAPSNRRDLRFVWSGDTAGQGWGIDLARGGMGCYETIRTDAPDFFIHSGDSIYADGPIVAEVTLDDGTIWRNVTTEDKSKVAETLKEFRGNYKYNLIDENVRRFNAEVPISAQWDDHEVLDNWYPKEMLTDGRHRERSVALLAARANRAFHEYQPIREQPTDRPRIYRRIAYGPRLDVFFLDMRSYRGDNGLNREPAPGPATAFLGREQIAWLKTALLESRATWKVIAADMPLGLVVLDRFEEPFTFENAANGPGPVLGREHEYKDLLRFVKEKGIRNLVWITADVHYTAAHRYDPNRAPFQDFEPFWEFVSGPLHAGTFGPNALDPTFGPTVVFQKSAEGKPNRPPSAGLQFYGLVEIDGASGVMTVALKDVGGKMLYSIDLEPKSGTG